MESTIIWVYTHHEKLPMRFINARRELTDSERNKVIRDVCHLDEGEIQNDKKIN